MVHQTLNATCFDLTDVNQPMKCPPIDHPVVYQTLNGSCVDILVIFQPLNGSCIYPLLVVYRTLKETCLDPPEVSAHEWSLS